MKKFIVSIRPADAKEFEFFDFFNAKDPEAAIKAFTGKYSAAQFRCSKSHDFRVQQFNAQNSDYFRVTVQSGCEFTDIQPLQEATA